MNLDLIYTPLSIKLSSRTVGIFKLLGMSLFMSAICLGQQASVPASQRQTALELEQAGRIDEAQVAWKSLLTTQPNSAEAYAHLGL